jgi:transcriptional regulator CtsR
MNVNIIISLLLHKAIITKDEADALFRALNETILPTEFSAAHKIVGSILAEVKDDAKKAEDYAKEEAAKLKAEKSTKK